MSARWHGSVTALVVGFALVGCNAGGGAGGDAPEAQEVADRTCEDERFAEISARDTAVISLEDGEIAVDPDTVRVRRGDAVQWRSARPFVVFVQRHADLGLPTDEALTAGRRSGGGDTSPSDVAVRGDTATGIQAMERGGMTARTRIREDAACGVYEYDLGVYDASTDRIVPLDPPVMVLPRRSG